MSWLEKLLPPKITHTDPTGDIERSPADWIMPMPPERDPHEWAAETAKMLSEREAVADRLVEQLPDLVDGRR